MFAFRFETWTESWWVMNLRHDSGIIGCDASNAISLLIHNQSFLRPKGDGKSAQQIRCQCIIHLTYAIRKTCAKGCSGQYFCRWDCIILCICLFLIAWNEINVLLRDHGHWSRFTFDLSGSSCAAFSFIKSRCDVLCRSSPCLEWHKPLVAWKRGLLQHLWPDLKAVF